MALLADFLPKVYAITDRPDLVVETTAALNRALLQAHYSSFFSFDIQQELIAAPGTQSFSSLLPARFRKVSTIDSIGNDSGMGGFNVKEITPAGLFDPRVFTEKQNCYYLAGANIQFRVTASWSQLVHQYFQIPAWADSYIADNYEHAIIYFASSKIFALTDQANEIKFYEALGREVINEIVQSHFAY